MRRPLTPILVLLVLLPALPSCAQPPPQPKAQQEAQPQEPYDGPVTRPLGATSLAFSPDSRLVLTSGYHWGIRLFDLASGKEIRSFKGHEGDYKKVAFSADGRRALSYGYSDYIFLWDVERGQEIRRLAGSARGTGRAIFTPDGRSVLAVGEIDGIVRLLDAASGEELRRFKAGENKEYVRSDISPSATRALSQEHNENVCLWDVERGALIRCFKLHDDTDIFQLFGQHAIFTNIETGAFRLVDVDGDRELPRIKKLKDKSVYDVSADGNLAIVVSLHDESGAPKVSVLDLRNGQEVSRLETKEKEHILLFGLSPDGLYVVGGCTDDALCLWDAKSGKLVRYLKAEEDWRQRLMSDR